MQSLDNIFYFTPHPMIIQSEFNANIRKIKNEIINEVLKL